MYKVKRALPWIAFIAALLAVLLLVAVSSQRAESLVDNGKTRQAAEAAVTGATAIRPVSLDDPDFRAAVEGLPGSAYISYVWLFAPDGGIAYSSARYANHGTVADYATAETKRLLDSLPGGMLVDEQRIALLAASAVQSEGEHNDVFGHMIRAVYTADGTLVGWIGVAYDISSQIGSPGTAYTLALFAWLLCMGVYWLALPVWAWLDARERGERAAIWAMFVLLGNLVALMAYLLTRSPRARKM